jgi:hypothetical protein
VVSALWSSGALWVSCPAVVECDISRKMDWMSRADCMAYSVAGSDSDRFFLVGTVEGARLWSPSLDYRRFV